MSTKKNNRTRSESECLGSSPSSTKGDGATQEQDVPAQLGASGTYKVAGDLQERDSKTGQLVPLPRYELVPCFECLAIAARIGVPDLEALDPCAFCNDARYVRMDPDKFPIVNRDPKHEEPMR